MTRFQEALKSLPARFSAAKCLRDFLQGRFSLRTVGRSFGTYVCQFCPVVAFASPKAGELPMMLYVFWAVLLNPMNWYPETRPTRMPLRSAALQLPDRSQLPGDGATHSIDVRRRA